MQGSKLRRKTRVDVERSGASSAVEAGRTACAILLAPRTGAMPVRSLPSRRLIRLWSSSSSAAQRGGIQLRYRTRGKVRLKHDS